MSVVVRLHSVRDAEVGSSNLPHPTKVKVQVTGVFGFRLRMWSGAGRPQSDHIAWRLETESVRSVAPGRHGRVTSQGADLGKRDSADATS